MKKTLICVLSSLWLATAPLMAQPQDSPLSSPVANSVLNADLFHQLLKGEMSVQGGEPAAGYALILDAARKTGESRLYQRAVDIALQSRSGDAALQAAKVWKKAQPESRDANRYVMQILIALNRLSDTLEPIKTEIELTPVADRLLSILSIPRAYASVSDKKQASTVVEQALRSYFVNSFTASAAWTTLGHMRLATSDAAGALEAVKKAQAADPNAEAPIFLAIVLMSPQRPEAQTLIQTYFARSPQVSPDIRMSYARVLLGAQRYAEATVQLQSIVRDKPDLASAWLILGSLQLQDSLLTLAQTSFERYVTLVGQQLSQEDSARGLSQAYLALAQIAEKRKDFDAAEVWIGNIQNLPKFAQDTLQVQTRRASMLASQGKLAEALQFIRSVPEHTPEDARLKLVAEAGLLRDLKQYQMAYDLLSTLVTKLPDDTELVYDQATLAEKIGNMVAMERLLRAIIIAKPDHHHAYNALGYAFADRSIRLPEARELIRKALEYVPSDPFIQDSLGWVEFRMGNLSEAVKIFEIAFKAKPDAEIAAHFGEVLWAIGQHDRAIAIWREAQTLSPDNDTLMATLKRFQVKP